MLSAISSLFFNLLLMANDQASINSVIPAFILIFAITIVVYIGLFVLRAIGICKMARRRKIKWWWVGMVPYANYALIGKLAGPIRIFNIDVKNMGIITAIVVALIDIANISPFIAALFLFEGGTLANLIASSITIFNSIFSGFVTIFAYVADIIFILSYFSLALAIFGKYAPQKRLLYTVLSLIQPLFNIFLFAIRNNKSYTNPDDYYREKMANRFGQTYNPYQNPYQTNENPFDDYGTNNKNDNQNPFDEY